MSFYLYENEAEMPESLFSEDGGPFTHCIHCNLDLHHPPQPYTFEKVFKRYPNTEKPQVLFEYAICDACAGSVREEFSEESLQNMRQYFENKEVNAVDWDVDDISQRLEHCMITGHNLEQEQEYAFVARGNGNKLLVGYYPFVVSLTAMDELSALLSEKTRETLDNFVQNNFTSPPEYSNVPSGGGKWVLV